MNAGRMYLRSSATWRCGRWAALAVISALLVAGCTAPMAPGKPAALRRRRRPGPPR